MNYKVTERRCTCMSCHNNLCIVCETDYCESEYFCVQIYDSNNTLILKKKIKSFEYLCVCITQKDIYKIKVSSFDRLSPHIAVRWVKLRPKCNDTQFFKFRSLHSCGRMCNASLEIRDLMYSQMPIRKGVLYLWHVISQ